ncbi:MAG: ABC transporter permease [Bacillota bacterium]|nr:ABC transporter permease [Bacillota bacterium]
MIVLKYIGKRLLISVFVIFGLSIVIFVISRVVPGDPARLALGARATPEAVAALTEQMHLNDSFPQQYFYWLKSALHGDLGQSLITQNAVKADILTYLPRTLELVVIAGLMLVIGSILLGTLAAAFQDSFLDNLIRVLSYVGVAVPSFVLAVLFVLYFGYINPIIPVIGRLGSEYVTPAAVTGFMSIDCLLAGDLPAFWNVLGHAFLPALALAAGPMFQEARIIRSAMTDNKGRDYLLLMKSYGLPRWKIIGKYLLKPSVIPAVSTLGMDLATLMGNAFMIETIFNWPGLSKYGMTAMLNKDLNAIAGVIIVYGIVFVLVNLVVDVISAYLDPRIRLKAV